MKPEEKFAILNLVNHLAMEARTPLVSLNWPEEDREVMFPDEPELRARPCDGVAIIVGPPYAIEHTGLMAYQHQEEWAGQYEPIRTGMKKGLSAVLAEGIGCDPVVPDIRVTGVPWEKYGERIGAAIIADRSTTPLGSRGIVQLDLNGQPYRVDYRLEKAENPDVWMAIRPRDGSEADLPLLMEKALKHKAPKLLLYKRRGYRTVLLIEGKDWANTNPKMLEVAYGEAASEFSQEEIPDAVFLFFTGTQALRRLK